MEPKQEAAVIVLFHNGVLCLYLHSKTSQGTALLKLLHFYWAHSYADIDKPFVLAWGSSKDVFKMSINIMAHCPGSFPLGMKVVSQDLSSKLRTLDGRVYICPSNTHCPSLLLFQSLRVKVNHVVPDSPGEEPRETAKQKEDSIRP